MDQALEVFLNRHQLRDSVRLVPWNRFPPAVSHSSTADGVCNVCGGRQGKKKKKRAVNLPASHPNTVSEPPLCSERRRGERGANGNTSQSYSSETR